jgi:RNA polymerase sigma-70 factor (ECF subfamily)
VTFGDDDSDEHLAACARQGDRGSFDALVKRHKEPIYRFIRRYVGHTDDAYDVLQECFIAAWRGMPKYEPARPFLPWLRQIALNKCRDFGRRQTVRRILLRAFSEERPAEQVPADQGASDALADAERLAELDKAIAGLPAFYKEPLLLTVVSGLSHQDAAKILKTTSKAVEMRLYRARRKILDALSRLREG